MSKYTSPEIEVEELDAFDIIVTSTLPTRDEEADDPDYQG